MQDASAQMALLQFMTCGMKRTAVPASIHCDHLIQGMSVGILRYNRSLSSSDTDHRHDIHLYKAFDGAESDLKRSIVTNKEVFDFLESAGKKYGIEVSFGFLSFLCFAVVNTTSLSYLTC